jgi:anhydro-N-acetylmuramic acid kinase
VTERPTLAIGIMSGTSLDGVDAALVRLAGPGSCSLVHFVTRAYAASERDQILSALAAGTAPDLARLHVRLAGWAADAVETLLAEAHTRASEIGFIAFHGQTIWHEPPAVSWQLGEPAVLAERFGVRVVSNFRSRDVAAGGQGAPLVPIADLLLFAHPGMARVLLNLGGMANATLVPPRGAEGGALAFDTGPGMVLIDAVARLVEPGARFDVDGRLAHAGRVRTDLLARLNGDPYFDRPPPKSTGREHFGLPLAQEIHRSAPGPDGVRTAVELTATTVARALARWMPGVTEVVASGGGVRHTVLWQRLSSELASQGMLLRRFDDLFFTGDAKEAVAFALLGYLTIHGQPGNLPAATGAVGPRVLGQITPA